MLGWAKASRRSRHSAHCLGTGKTVVSLKLTTGDEDTVVLFGYREPSLVYYLGRPVPTFNSPTELAAFLDENGPAFTLLRDSELARLRKQPDIRIGSNHRTEGRSIQGITSPSVLVARLSKSSNLDAAAINRSDLRLDSRK